MIKEKKGTQEEDSELRSMLVSMGIASPVTKYCAIVSKLFSGKMQNQCTIKNLQSNFLIGYKDLCKDLECWQSQMYIVYLVDITAHVQVFQSSKRNGINFSR
jgi:hypothetical protein